MDSWIHNGVRVFGTVAQTVEQYIENVVQEVKSELPQELSVETAKIVDEVSIVKGE